MARAENRIAAAIRRRQYWESELGRGYFGVDSIALAYRWLCALRKVKRARHGGADAMAQTYLQHVADYMLWVAREISTLDQMTSQQAYDYCKAYEARQRERVAG